MPFSYLPIFFLDSDILIRLSLLKFYNSVVLSGWDFFVQITFQSGNLSLSSKIFFVLFIPLIQSV